ncbi:MULTISPECIES: hypothetical protein [unclassified Microbacterium]|uniref:hypothetical protein n=1 Tax=unclassified Microbacterium TaxID=2609290 RepID=UPI00214B63D2|nr:MULTISPECIES: hypothetical protein [unclassified Microbacterium]MCR2808719.1 hypothetical protein [Microbacterium sp. zg.B185]WIM18850.1 hypothetical protein QNO12_14885 [Microbacterium sp. zg-B185]
MATYRIEPAFDSVDVALGVFDDEGTQFAAGPIDRVQAVTPAPEAGAAEQHP